LLKVTEFSKVSKISRLVLVKVSIYFTKISKIIGSTLKTDVLTA